jgi:hypothetical protein
MAFYPRRLESSTKKIVHTAGERENAVRKPDYTGN